MLGQWVHLTPTKLLLSVVDIVIRLSSDVIRGLLQLLLLLLLLVRSARLECASHVLTCSAHVHMLLLHLLLWHVLLGVLQLCTISTLWLLLLLLIVHVLLGSV